MGSVNTLAGYFDGEGCIRLRDGRVILEITACWKPWVEKFRARYGGSLRRRSKREAHHKQQWTWELTDQRDVTTCLHDLCWHLEEKAAQAHLALIYRARVDLGYDVSGFDGALKILKTMEFPDDPAV